MPDSDEPLDIDEAAKEAQYEVLCEIAFAAGVYFRQFEQAGLPAELAADLVRDWHASRIRQRSPLVYREGLTG